MRICKTNISVDNEQEAADQNVDDEKKPVNYFYCNWYSYYTNWDNKRDDCSNNDWNSQSDWNDHERSDRSGRNDHNDVWNHNRDAGKGKGSERHDDWNSRSHDRSGGGMSGWDGGPPAKVLQKQLQRRAARQLLRLILAESCMK